MRAARRSTTAAIASKDSSMPTDCEPCPGNTKAIFIDFDAPSSNRTSTEPQVNPPPTPCSSTFCPWRMRPSRTRDVECQRHRGGRRVAMLVDRYDQSVFADTQALGGRGQDADVGLMRDQPVDRRSAGRPPQEPRRAESASTLTASLNTACPSIVRNGCSVTCPLFDPASGTQGSPACDRPHAAATRGCRGYRSSRARRRLLHRRTARRSSGRSSRGCGKTPRRRSPARDGSAAAHHRVGNRQAVDETAADRLHVERRAAGRPVRPGRGTRCWERSGRAWRSRRSRGRSCSRRSAHPRARRAPRACPASLVVTPASAM